MPITLPPLVELLPWIYALALFPTSLLQTRERCWLLARSAGYLGLSLVLAAWLQAAFDEQNNDRLGLAMAGLVSLLAFVIIDYSRRYLEGEPEQRRYVLALLSTLAAVATVVISTDLLLLIGAWSFSSLCLYQLLTFYRDRPQALVVANKKFLASRLADICLLLCTGLLVHAGGDSTIAVILEDVNNRLQVNGQLGWDLQLAALLLALAVIFKSAQLPVHGWLIQVMEAPTPVSALLHAGLVNLGGFVLLRFAPLFSAAVPAQSLLVLVGGLTAVVAALVMMTRISIKVRLAWSTCAQMGMMLLECGQGLYELALVHLLAHSLYKAHAFLAAGETVATARLHALQAAMPLPRLTDLLCALLLASLALALALLQGVWTWQLPAHQLPLMALAILAIGLAPWCLRRGQVLQRLSMFALLLAAYMLWHQAATWILAPPPTEAPLLLQGLALLLFVGLYMAQALILARPQGALAQRLYPSAFAGFYLDEYFTRLTFRLWPARSSQRLTSTTGDRP
ncbi:NADH-quinone oxidoreductase subunit L [Pseudomonas carnis]|uniref:NADH-quinone oxidoreductase subunit L n=1 Tax=Pseudomonas carnis TaxID=2487355 RepID=UPI0018E5FD63|nr:NADH-quinone oxidoreductase subunit L [Pseudomonas carnis]MBI6664380.1 NADH-quinone oxidoreductase subunit L [Pseudomonas carnis]MBI6689516.1 NADH-quinone oxidoreductase subunit L [Pseudomonas carnis]